MDVTEMVQYILNNAVAIGVLVYLLVYEMPRRDKEHKEEVSALTKAVENNTLVLTRLVEKMEGN